MISGNAFSVTYVKFDLFSKMNSQKKQYYVEEKRSIEGWCFQKCSLCCSVNCSYYIKIFLIFYFQSTGEIRTSYRRCSIKKCSWKFCKFYRKTSVPEYCNFIKKETPRQYFFCEFCKIFKNIFFTERLWTTASDKC